VWHSAAAASDSVDDIAISCRNSSYQYTYTLKLPAPLGQIDVSWFEFDV
jgi:hypothetical protein